MRLSDYYPIYFQVVSDQNIFKTFLILINMNTEISDRLTDSVVKHVPMLLDKEKFYNFFVSTNIDVHASCTFLGETSVKDERCDVESYCMFYPILLIQNSTIRYVPGEKHPWRNLLENMKQKSPDYLARLQTEKDLITIMNRVVLKNNISGFSVLGILENTNFTYNNGRFPEDEKKFVKPQLIIPGYEKNPIIKSWEDSQTRSYSNSEKTFRFDHLFH